MENERTDLRIVHVSEAAEQARRHEDGQVYADAQVTIEVQDGRVCVKLKSAAELYTRHWLRECRQYAEGGTVDAATPDLGSHVYSFTPCS